MLINFWNEKSFLHSDSRTCSESVETSFTSTMLLLWDLNTGHKTRTRIWLPYVDILMCQSSQRIAEPFSSSSEFLLVKTIGRRDLTHVVDLTATSRLVHTGLDTGDYGVEQDFAYPLIANIRDHAHLQVFNVQVKRKFM